MANQQRKKTHKRRGGSFLTEVSVPAFLLYANNTLGKKKSYTSKGMRKKFRKTSKKYR